MIFFPFFFIFLCESALEDVRPFEAGCCLQQQLLSGVPLSETGFPSSDCPRVLVSLDPQVPLSGPGDAHHYSRGGGVAGRPLERGLGSSEGFVRHFKCVN